MNDVFYITPDVSCDDGDYSTLSEPSSAIEESVFYELPDCLQESYLEVCFSTPSDLRNPTVEDINGVHIINWAGVHLARKINITGSNRQQILEMINNLVTSVTKDEEYEIVVEEKKPDGLSYKEVTVNAGHLLQAISYGFVDLFENTTAELDWIDQAVRECMTNHKPVVVDFNGFLYKLVSAEKVYTSDTA